MDRPIVLINAPVNLGLRPLRPGHVPGTWHAPEALIRAGLAEVIQPDRIVDLPRPTYRPPRRPAVRLLNGCAIRDFNLSLAPHVAAAFAAGHFAFVVGGDCSVLLGPLAGLRRHGPVSLVHIDGHSDFRHPGNHDPETTVGAVAGMDLALVTGRGAALLTDWPEVGSALVPDVQVVQIGERESRDPDYAWPDISETEITRIDVFAARELGAEAVLRRACATLDRVDWPFWIHLDVDVLDQDVMPAVDSPGRPGLEPDMLAAILWKLLSDDRSAGLTLTIFDPDLDPDGRCARVIVGIISAAFGSYGMRADCEL